MNAEEIHLVEPTESLRDAYLDLVQEVRGAGDSYVDHEWEEVHRDFAAWVRKLRNHAKGLEVPPGWVPASSYWLVQGVRVIGTCCLRHRLTEALRDFGGNVGYCVRPGERRKGHATFMLKALLEKAREMGIGRLLVTCDHRNAASIGVIRMCGGILDSESFSPRAGRVTQRYSIDL